MLSVWAIYEVTSFPSRVFLCFIWNPTTHTSVHSMVPKRSFLVTSGKFCCFLVELFHTETCGVCGEGRSRCWAPGSQCASVSQAVEILLRYFLTVLSWALPKKQGRSLEGGEMILLWWVGALPLLLQRMQSLTGRGGEMLAGVKGKTLWVGDFIQVMQIVDQKEQSGHSVPHHPLGERAEQGRQGWLSTARRSMCPILSRPWVLSHHSSVSQHCGVLWVYSLPSAPTRTIYWPHR